jgi:hypothetical protein
MPASQPTVETPTSGVMQNPGERCEFDVDSDDHPWRELPSLKDRRAWFGVLRMIDPV